MNKNEILKNLFLLPREDILDILEVINGYKSSTNRSTKDKLGLRAIFMAGYHSTEEFYKAFNLTKDCSIAKLVVRGQAFNIKTFFKLQEMLGFSDEMLLEILKEVE